MIGFRRSPLITINQIFSAAKKISKPKGTEYQYEITFNSKRMRSKDISVSFKVVPMFGGFYMRSPDIEISNDNDYREICSRLIPCINDFFAINYSYININRKDENFGNILRRDRHKFQRIFSFSKYFEAYYVSNARSFCDLTAFIKSEHNSVLSTFSNFGEFMIHLGKILSSELGIDIMFINDHPFQEILEKDDQEITDGEKVDIGFGSMGSFFFNIQKNLMFPEIEVLKMMNDFFDNLIKAYYIATTRYYHEKIETSLNEYFAIILAHSLILTESDILNKITRNCKINKETISKNIEREEYHIVLDKSSDTAILLKIDNCDLTPLYLMVDERNMKVCASISFDFNYCYQTFFSLLKTHFWNSFHTFFKIFDKSLYLSK